MAIKIAAFIGTPKIIFNDHDIKSCGGNLEVGSKCVASPSRYRFTTYGNMTKCLNSYYRRSSNRIEKYKNCSCNNQKSNKSCDETSLHRAIQISLQRRYSRRLLFSPSIRPCKVHPTALFR